MQFTELISTLSSILDLDENIKLYHAWRTALIAYRMAKLIVPKEAVQIFYAALLHDVGAVGLKDHIVHYANLLDHGGQENIRLHPEVGARIVAEIPGLQEASRYILDHHEMYNGQGYPYGKKGDELSIGSQILYIADHFDLLLRNESMKRTDIYNYYRTRKGQNYALELWPVFLEVLHSDGGTFFHLISDTVGYLPLMHQALQEVSQIPLDLPENFLDQVVKVFGKIIDAKHSYTQGHTERVVQYSQIVGETVGLTTEELHTLQRGAYLHDIGKLGVPVAILDKKGRLTDEEFYKVKKHIIITMEVLDSMSFLRNLTEISGYHHTRWDGNGYPDRVAGEEISLEARILCIADSFDAMTSSRAYRDAQSYEYAWSELRKHAGTQFDPYLVKKIDRQKVSDRFKKVYLSQFASISEVL